MNKHEDSHSLRATTILVLLSIATACEKTDDQSASGNEGGRHSGGESSSAGRSVSDETAGGRAGSGSPDGLPGVGDAGSGGSAGDAINSRATAPVALRAAGEFAILAKSGISAVPTSSITGDVGLSPAAATFLTGFSLTADPSNAFSSSTQVSGKLYAADYATPTPEDLTTAIGDMQLAFADAAGRAPDVSELGAGSIGGMTLTPGVYQWTTGLLIPSNVTLKGDANAVWIFQVAQNLNMSSGTSVVLAGGALAKNVFWQVAGLVEFGTTSHCEGVVLTQTSVTMNTGASITGRLLAQTAVEIDNGTVVAPAQ